MGTTINIIGLLLILILILISFPKELRDIPAQDVARWTRYPAWHPVIIDYDYEVSDSLVLLAFLVTATSGYLGLKWSLTPPKYKKYITYFYKDEKTTPTTAFILLLSYYILITGLCVSTYWMFDVGKLWSATGLLHNLLEIALLVVLHNGGKLNSNVSIAWFGGYGLLIMLLNMKLSWPYDALWFKIQGLCTDYALVVQFIRIYFLTRKNLDEANDEQLPLNNDEQSTSVTSATSQNLFPNSVSHPNQLILLILASIVHVIGNISNSVWVQSTLAFQVFQLSYAITWPLYAYYIYVDTRCASKFQKRIYIPDTSKGKVILIVILNIILSIGTIRFAIFIQSL